MANPKVLTPEERIALLEKENATLLKKSKEQEDLIQQQAKEAAARPESPANTVTVKHEGVLYNVAKSLGKITIPGNDSLKKLEISVTELHKYPDHIAYLVKVNSPILVKVSK